MWIPEIHGLSQNLNNITVLKENIQNVCYQIIVSIFGSLKKIDDNMYVDGSMVFSLDNKQNCKFYIFPYGHNMLGFPL